MENQKIADIWEKELTDKDLHIIASKRRLRNIFKWTIFKPFIDFKNKIIIDYGCGGGQLIIPAFEHGIKKYIGLDITQRSIDHIKNTYWYVRNIELFKINPWNFMVSIKKKQKDIFVSNYCIQHFPTQEYLDGFLYELNKQKYEWIILNYRFAHNNIFRDNPYEEIRDIIYSCLTNAEYINSKLTNYESHSTIDMKSKGMECGYWHDKQLSS